MEAEFKIMELFNILDNLKHLKRTGWVHFEIPEPETVASHMYRMAVLATALQETSDLDVTRCIKMTLVHDIAEAIVGDITPRCGVSGEKKFQLEEDAIIKISSLVPAWVGKEWLELWHEYEAATTPEAISVKQLDKLDMIAQACSYEKKYHIDLSEFFNSAPPETFTTQPFIKWAEAVRNSRPTLNK